MTTEVAVMNRIGIALAADSAVTIGGDKVYNTVNKLFMLSKHHPVGVMIYGNSLIMGVPWETAIKCYREQLGSESFASLSDYSSDFVEYLRTRFLNTSALHADGLREVASKICLLLRESVVKALSGRSLDSSEVHESAKEIATDTIQSFSDLVSRYIDLGENQTRIEEFDAKNGNEIDRVASEVLEGVYPLLDVNIKAALRNSLCEYFHSTLILGDSSGVVIAGFGENELFPKAITLNIEGFFGTTDKFEIESGKSNCKGDDQFNSSIIPFAQSDVIYSFVAGIDRMLDSEYEKAAQAALDSIVNSNVASSLSVDARNELLENRESALETMMDRIDGFRRARYIGPITEMLDSLPKDELAEMAETLVNLSAFRKKVTKGTESVGGPIDVAVITKGDGFVWINRKHYFDSKLNHHFFATYYNA